MVRIESVELTAARRERMGIVWNGGRLLAVVLGNKGGAEEPSRGIGAALRANMLETLRPLKLVWKAEEDHE